MSGQMYSDDATRLTAAGTRQIVQSGKYALDVSIGMQKVMLEEMAKASGEILDRVREEIEIASEFVARIASAHSVREIASACSDCSQHQADALRHDGEMLLRQSQRFCEQTSKLLAAGQPVAG